MPSKISGILAFKGVKIALVVAGTVVAAGVAVQGYAIFSDNDDLNVAKQIQDTLEGAKNEPIGCCLPHCGESGETVCLQSAGQTWMEGSCSELGDECEEGCCYPYGDMTRAACTLVGGKDWYKGECEKGFHMNIAGVKKGTIEVSGITWTWKYSLTAYTCAEDLYNAEWQGDWVWDWKAVDPEGNVFPDYKEGSAAFITSDGEATYSIADTPITLDLSTDSVHMEVDFQPLGEMTADGNVTKGDNHCKNK